MATCKHCGSTEGEFNSPSVCKPCRAAYIKAYRQNPKNREVILAREKSHPRSKRNSNEWRALNPNKYKAQTALGNAVRDGKVVKGTSCEQCKSETKVVGHHDDYNKPLVVRWLCCACHNQWHADNGEGANGS